MLSRVLQCLGGVARPVSYLVGRGWESLTYTTMSEEGENSGGMNSRDSTSSSEAVREEPQADKNRGEEGHVQTVDIEEKTESNNASTSEVASNANENKSEGSRLMKSSGGGEKNENENTSEESRLMKSSGGGEKNEKENTSEESRLMKSSGGGEKNEKENTSEESRLMKSSGGGEKNEKEKAPADINRESDVGKKEGKDENPSAAKNQDGARKQQAEASSGGFFGGLLKRFKTDMPKRDREYYESLSLEEKRRHYKNRNNYVTLEEIETWPETRKRLDWHRKRSLPDPLFNPFPLLDKKVSLWRGDITQLEIGAIVNAANSSLLGGGGVDGAIHRAAGHSLYDECLTLNGCPTGQTKITSGHALPAKYILHTVGPFDGSEEDLKSCYSTCLDLVEKHSIKSVAFCCIATGVYGYPNHEAADIALDMVRRWLEKNSEKVERIIFCVFLEKDLRIYRKKLHQYFPDDIEVDQERLKASIREGRKDETDTTTREESRDTSGEDLKLSNKDNDNSTVPSDAINEGSKPPLVRSASEPDPSVIKRTTTRSIEQDHDAQKSSNNNDKSEPMEGVSEGDNDGDQGSGDSVQLGSTCKKLKEEDGTPEDMTVDADDTNTDRIDER